MSLSCAIFLPQVPSDASELVGCDGQRRFGIRNTSLGKGMAAFIERSGEHIEKGINRSAGSIMGHGSSRNGQCHGRDVRHRIVVKVAGPDMQHPAQRRVEAELARGGGHDPRPQGAELLQQIA